MERAIIKDNDRTIMLYLDDNSNAYGYIFEKDGRVIPADNSVLSYFNVFRLSKNITILPETGQYLVILDNETNLKHYYLNGVEDYYMLFRNNGELAIDFSAGDGLDEDKLPLSRRFFIKGMSLLLSLSMMLGVSSGLASNDKDVVINPLTVNDIFRLINNSNLSSGDKRQLKQEEFFNMILPYINSDPVLIKNFEDQLNNLSRKFVTDEQFESVAPSVDTSIYNGYVNRNVPGVINIRQKLPLNVYIDIFSHEFLALCKAPNLKYNVLSEAMEEQLSFEFFPGTYIGQYFKQVEQLRKMAELAGPEALIIYYTTGSMDLIDEKFKPILGDERYEDFLKTLQFKRLPKEDDPNYGLIKAYEQDREARLDGYINEISQKMGIKFTEEVPNMNPYNVTHYYFGGDSIRLMLLKGLSVDLETAYKNGIIGFSRYGDPEKNPISYEEAVQLYEEQDEVNRKVVVTYDENGESSYTWDGAGITSYNGRLFISPHVPYVANLVDASSYCDDLNNEPGNYFIPGGLNVNDGTMRYNSSEDLSSVYWRNDHQIEVIIGGKEYCLSPEEASSLFADNPGVTSKIDYLLGLSSTSDDRSMREEPVGDKVEDAPILIK